MDPITGSNPTNNPRLDFIHNTGSSQQLAGAAGTYGPDTAPVQPPAPAKPRVQPSLAPRSAASYVSSAEASKPPTLVPLPKPTSTPEPRFADTAKAAVPTERHSSWRVPALLGVGLLILLVVAGGSWWWLTKRVPAKPSAPAVAAAPVMPKNLEQEASTGAIEEGKTVTQSGMTFSFDIPTSATAGSFTPELELEPVGTAFTGTPTTTGKPVATGGGSLHVSLNVNNLKNGSYHWQVRDSVGSQHSTWTTLGSTSQVAFVVAAPAPNAPVVTTIAGGGVTNPTITSSNQPPIAGTASPNASITVTVAPDSQTFTATADSNGSWSLTPSAAIPNGQHTLSIVATDGAGNASTAAQVALTINPATVAQTTPSAGASGAPAATSKPVSSNLAATGDNTTLVSGIALGVMVLAGAGMLWLRRRYAAF
jgi:hypothetical protein